MPRQDWADITVGQLSAAKRKLQIGPAGSWLPDDGAAGTVLVKLSAADYDVGWGAIAGVVVAGNGLVFVGNVLHFAQAAAYTPGAIPFASGVATMGFDATNLFWDAANLRLGVGTNAPADRLHVTRDYTDAASHFMGRFTTTTSVSGGAKRTLYGEMVITGANNFAGSLVTSGVFQTLHQGSGTVSGATFVGVEVYAGKGPLGTGAMDTATGIYVQTLNQNATGAITNTYDIYIATPITTGAIGQNYGIYQQSTAAWNYFGGNIAIGFPGFTDHVGVRFEKTFNTASHAVGIQSWVSANPPADTAEFNAGGSFKGTTTSGFNYTNYPYAACGVICSGVHDGTGTCAAVSGIVAVGQQLAVGAVTAAHGLVGQVAASNAGGTITSGYGVRVLTPTITGAITNYYGLYLQAGGGGTSYGVYQAGASDINYFAGKVGIGVVPPAVKLHVYGLGAAPSLVAANGIFLIGNDITQALEIGCETGAPYAIWFQGRRTSLDGTSWPLKFNPLGGNVLFPNASGLNYFAGFLALGSTSPVNTTFALFGASTASISSMRITAGTAAYAGTVEGDFWNDYTQKCLIGYIDGLKQYDSRVMFVATADKVVTNTNAETTLFGTGIGTLTFPANFFVVGKTVRITLRGRHTMDATPPDLTFRIKLGAVTFASKTYSDLNDTDRYIEITFILTCRSTGAGGTGIGQGGVFMAEGSDDCDLDELVMTATAAMNTTGTLALDVTCQPSVADAGSSLTITNALVEVLA